MKPPSVFIIASNADYAPAWRVQQQLTKEGSVDCFFCDEALLRIGEKGYQARAERALDHASSLIVVAGSRDRVDSEWVRHIWRRYLETPGVGRTVVTVCCEGLAADELPRSLRRRTGSLTFPDELESLPDRLAGRAAPPLPSSPRRPRSMRLLAAITGMNALILATVIWLVLHHRASLLPDSLTDSSAATHPSNSGLSSLSPGLARSGSSDHTGASIDPSAIPDPSDPDSLTSQSPGVIMPAPGSAAVASITETPSAGTPFSLSVGNIRLTFAFVPPGSFTMGSPATEFRRDADEPQHFVEITRGFWLARTECTQSLWRSVMETEPSKFTGHPDLPVETVSWNDIAGPDDSFLVRMNRRHRLPAGWTFALPTEAQWEYACRAGTHTPFSFGASLNGSLANCDGLIPYATADAGPYLARTTRAGSYPPNPWGLYDMHGNVAEFCADDYTASPPGGRDPLVSSGGASRTIRGGSWWQHGSDCRSASREGVSQTLITDNIGFRLALVPAR